MSDDDGLPTSEVPAVHAHEGHHLPGSTAAALAALEHRLMAQARSAHQLERELLPAWLRPTKGEHRWQMGTAVIVAIALELSLPARLTLKPHYVFPIVEGAILVALFVASPGRMVKHTIGLHVSVLVLLGLISADNGISAGFLVHEIVTGTGASGPRLLVEGVAIWLTNVIVFGLWYWEFDRGGPVQRMLATRPYPDFQFPQMENPDLAPKDWEPMFVDYLYVSFTNAMAFSPTDTMPLSRWAKLTMLLQSGVSILLVVLVIARAVNILK
jgi:uncharacterized membrane protein